MPNRVRGRIASKARAERVSAKQRQEIRRYSQASDDTAASALAAHVAAGDPHTGYRLESADHTHESTGVQAGQIDHGLALTGLGDDDHTQYRLVQERVGTYSDADTTPTVSGINFMVVTNSGATSISTFDDGVAGQMITLLFTDGNTTLTNSASLNLAGSVDFVSSADDVLTLVYSTNWYEVSRSVN